MAPDRVLDVVIVGGGIAGLTVAHELEKQASGLDWTLLEASNRLGGKLRTERIAHDDSEFIVESGPDAFLATKPWAKELATELGLADRLVPINRMPAPAALLKNGRIVDLPAGILLAAPTKLGPFARTPLLSPAGKLRAALDLVMPARRDDSDESVGAFIRRRLGGEMLDWVAEPLMAGIYNADPELLSLHAAFPQFRKMELTHRSLIRGLRQANSSNRQPAGPAFLTLRGGMQELTDTLSARLGNRIRTSCAVHAIVKQDDHVEVRVDNEQPLAARAVVLATPASAAARLLAGSPASSALMQLRTSAAGTITLAFPTRSISRPLRGYGLVIPARENAPINAITDASRKFPGRSPAGWTSLRVFFGGARSPETMALDDDGLIAVVRQTLRDLLGIADPPALCRIHRWPQGSPQYDVGHLARVGRIEQALPDGVFIAGSAYHGVGIPDIVHDARRVVTHVLDRIRTTSIAHSTTPH